MAEATAIFHAPYARRIPDPNFHKSDGVERHVFFVPVRRVPKGLSLDPNARTPNLNRRVYRQVKDSLLNLGDSVPGSFHLKHKGITVIAQAVDKRSEEDYQVSFHNGHGVVDGGHTYELITSIEENELPEDQFVKFEILVGIPEDWIVDIAGGLNTSVQVQPMSLDNLEGKFDWLKDLLKPQSYFDQIAWREGDEGDFDARDILSLMTCLNIDLFPNDEDEHPLLAYKWKARVLSTYEENPDKYKKQSEILTEIFELYDTISFEARDLWNKAGGKFGALAFVEERKRGEFRFPFIGKTGKYRLTNGALYPMLAAFRWMVEEDPRSEKHRWKGGFDRVLDRWTTSAEELMKATVQASNELGRNPNAIGKSRNHWSNLHARIAMRDLMARNESKAV